MQPKIASVYDFQDFAKLAMSQKLYTSLEDGAMEQVTKKLNEDDFVQIKLKQRGMANLLYYKGHDTTILGHKIKTPLGICPIPFQKQYHYDAEIATSQAAEEFGAVFTIDARPSVPLAEIIKESPLGLKLLRLCVNMDPNQRNQIMNEAKNEKTIIGIVLSVGTYGKIDSQVRGVQTTQKPYAKSWKLSDIKEIKEKVQKPIIIKGIMNGKDAVEAVNNGADAIWISNSGGRFLDSQPSTISVLRGIKKALQSSKNPHAEVYIDGGIRRGTDVMKCLAFGAQVVFIGRPAMWGLFQGGKDGVELVLNLLTDELKTAMVLTNTMEISKINEEQVIHEFRYKL